MVVRIECFVYSVPRCRGLEGGDRGSVGNKDREDISADATRSWAYDVAYARAAMARVWPA